MLIGEAEIIVMDQTLTLSEGPRSVEIGSTVADRSLLCAETATAHVL